MLRRAAACCSRPCLQQKLRLNTIAPTTTAQCLTLITHHSRGFNYKCAGASRAAPPLPEAAARDGPWAVDVERLKVGYGRDTYAATKELLGRWGQFQLPWAQVDAATPIAPGGPVCVAARVFGLWTAVPLQLL